MRVNQRELVLLPFPFSNLENTKVRPALIVSNNKFNQRSDDCIMVPLTSVIKNESYSILIEQKDLSSGKLMKTSRIRSDKIFCADKSLITMKIGKITDITFSKVKKAIIQIF